MIADRGLAELSASKRELVEFLWQKKRAFKGTPARHRPVASGKREHGECALSFAQERLWVLESLQGRNASYNINASASLSGTLDKPALERSLAEIVRRHEALRTYFGSAEGTPKAFVDPKASVAWTECDLSGSSSERRSVAFGDRLAEEAGRPFDLGRAPLARVHLFKLDAREHVLLICVHHIVADGWSMGVLLAELASLYGVYARGEESSLPELPVQYADYALWQRDWLQGDVLEQQVRYWKERLSGAPAALDLPTDHPRPTVPSFGGGMVPIRLSAALTGSLNALARREAATLYMLLLAAYQVLLKAYSGQTDIVVGSPIAGRPRRELEGLIGFFANTLVMRTDLSGDPPFREVLGRVKETALGAYAHQDLPFEKLVEVLQPARDLSRQPIFQTMMALQNVPRSPITLPSLELRPLGETVVSAKFDLSLFAWEGDGGLQGYFEYATDLFDRATIERLAGHFEVLLEGVVADPDGRLSELPLLATAERRLLLQEWNATQAAYPQDRCVHELFSAQAARTPESVAVEFDGRQLTYRELDSHSNQLGHHLRGLGVGSETIVALYVERSLEMVIGLLGVLKAGGAYLPLDPSYPVERLSYMLGDAGARVLLTQSSLADMLPAVDVVVRLDIDRQRIGEEPQQPPDARARPDYLAYVIYTSGSTGRPKGVMVQHSAVVNLLTSMASNPGLWPGDALAAVTPLSFDIAALEIYLPLLCGARLIVLPRAVAVDGDLLKGRLQESGVTALQATPSTWRLLLDAGWSSPSTKAFCGGEALPADLASKLAESAAAAWNLYGPTETTIWSAVSRVTQGGPVTIGKPISNTQLYVLDEGLRPVPVGVPGELYIGGAGLARGYLGRPDLTAERFVADPFGDGSRLYRTGDVARWLADGSLECRGRLDQQVKVRGYRIEPAEIEAVLLEQPGVDQAVVVACDDGPGDKQLVAWVVPRPGTVPLPESKLGFGLFYFAEGVNEDPGDGGIYRLYLEGARLADELGFAAVWTPERHFTQVAEAYSSPSVLSAALAITTKRIQLRAGSVVLPLHDPLRVAEEWSIVDNLSGGRVGVAFASGWLPDDFVFAPERYADRTRITRTHLTQVRQLWRGEGLTRTNGEGNDIRVELRPRPIQPELPTWLTTTGSAPSFEAAGALGVNVLTALLNQSIEELAANIACYRSSLVRHGHDPSRFCVTLMLHTFVAETEEAALEHARAPLRGYLASHARLRESLLKQYGPDAVVKDVDVDSLLDELLKRYLSQASLIGSPATCLSLLERLHQIGVNEIACLVDFGVEPDLVLANLKNLRRLQDCSELQLDKPELQQQLTRRLPAYMIPRGIRVLDRLPLTANGKVDHQRLRDLSSHVPDRVAYAAPKTDVETALAEMWAGVLRRPRVGIGDNFFELGGHSLQAIRLVEQIQRRFEVDVSLRALFEAPTIAAIADQIERGKSRQAAAPEQARVIADPASRHLPFPLTDIQQAYWIGRSRAFVLGNIAAHSYFEFAAEALDLGRFERALRRVIDRHDMLRAVVLPTGEQQALGQVPTYQVRCRDLQALGPSAAVVELDAIRASMSHLVHDASQWPLFEFRVSLLPGGNALVHVSFDILIGDAWSFRIFSQDLARYYADPDAAAAPPDCTFRDYVIARQGARQSPRHAAARRYWQDRLDLLPAAPVLPLARRPESIEKPWFERLPAILERESWQALQARAHGAGITSATVLLAAFADIIGSFSNSAHFLVNLIVFNREPLHPAIGQVIGDFTSMSLLEVTLQRDAPFRERARQLQSRMWQDLDHSAVSGVEVLRDMSRRAGTAITAPVVFTSMLGVDDAVDGATLFAGQSRLIYGITQTPQVMLDCQVSERNGDLVIAWDVVAELFPADLVAAMLERYTTRLRRLASGPTLWEETALLALPEDQAFRRKAINETRASFQGTLLHEPFLRQAALHEDSVAVVAPGRCLTYGEVERRTRHVARQLQDAGVHRNQLVAVVMEKGWEQVIAALAILRAGAAYLPIDPSLPDQRLLHLLRHGEVAVALSQSWLADVVAWPEGLSRLFVDTAPPAEACEQLLPVEQSGGDIAYVIYTSGSTGLPKGVIVSHQSALNTVLDVNERCAVGAHDRVLAVSSLSFDLSVYDMFGLLAAGGAIVFAEATAHPDPSRWLKAVVDAGVTIWNSVPSLLRLLIDEVKRSAIRPASLSLAMLSGDWIPLGLPDDFRGIAGPARVLAMGGATEAAIWSNYKWVEEIDPDWTSIPYGRPLANQQLHILDPGLEPCPDWVEGDLYIGGLGLAIGYWKDDERTAAAFVHHPRTGDRLYRTGDLGRYRPEGEVEFLGRNDQQVKVQGYRVELGEVEAALAQCQGVRDAVVLAHGEKRGDKRLVAYVLADPGIDLNEARKALVSSLPSYMVPHELLRLEELPLTSNGKVDRKALVALGAATAPKRVVTPPRDELEKAIAEIWTGVLGSGQPGVHDNFFELGGDSATLLKARALLAEKLEREIPVATLFEHPTISALSDYLRDTSVQNAFAIGQARGEARRQWRRQRGRPEPSAQPAQELRDDSASDVAMTIYHAAHSWRHHVVDGTSSIVSDPMEREEFRIRHHGVRRLPASIDAVTLTGCEDLDSLPVMMRRQSARQFAMSSVSTASLGTLLSCLRSRQVGAHKKHRYASAGGLYPIQVYIAVHEVTSATVSGLAPGAYYYNPEAHSLEPLTIGNAMDASMHLAINQPVFRSSAFSIYLVSEQQAIGPMYGAEGMRFALLEAGMMAQLLGETAPRCELGLCHVGGVDFERYRPLLRLGDSHVLLHSFLGGRLSEAATGWDARLETEPGPPNPLD